MNELDVQITVLLEPQHKSHERFVGNDEDSITTCECS